MKSFEEEIFHSLQSFPIPIKKIYYPSFFKANHLTYGLIRTGEGKKWIVLGEKEAVLKDPFRGSLYPQTLTLKVCDLSWENTQTLMELFPFTKPIPLKEFPTTLGTGDRLGLATPGHIRALRKYKVYPVLAQQSVRENRQTGRNFKQVIQDVAWAVVQEKYESGYGADGDHLKSLQDLKEALDAGVSMITLDLSDKFFPEAFRASREEIERRFEREIEEDDRKVLLHLFLNKEFSFGGSEGFSIQFTEEEVKRNSLLFWKGIEFSEEIYEFLKKQTGRKLKIDFEISIDETPFPTSLTQHLFLIISLLHRGILIDSLAPRFVGEFKKGIDYRGEISSFRKQFSHHQLIAQSYGNYKLSLHSGSDKFSLFPHIGELTKGRFHLKTSGTSWLEAIRLIALTNPALFREILQEALNQFEEAAKLYSVTLDLTRIPAIESLSDRGLPKLLEQDEPRKLLHITYGSLLKYPLKDRIINTLIDHEEDYWSLLEGHIERHLHALGIKKGKNLWEG
ncbi:MAG: tagaturonate epimerase family protein [Thermodesulfobacteriota bacterium]